MAKRVAVVTDAVCPEFYFPLWHRYYGTQFGPDNLHVITLDTEARSFRDFMLGSITTVPKFNNRLRVEVVNRVVNELFSKYETVIRADTDEFLVADPTHRGSLREYLHSVSHSHITAYGFNIIPDRGQAPLDLNKPILFHQRHLAHPYDALTKTCVTSIPMRWAPGFHFCSERPQFDSLFLFHTKLADLDIQIQIGEKVASNSDENMFIEYHRTARQILEKRLASIHTNEREHGPGALYRTKYFQEFSNKIFHTDNFGGIYHGGSFGPESILVELTSEFADTF